MTEIRRIEVWPKRNEPGAFQVRIQGGDFAKTPYKWFYGQNKIFPAKSKFFGRENYGRICNLIREAHANDSKVVWQKPIPRSAYGHQRGAQASGACDPDDNE